MPMPIEGPGPHTFSVRLWPHDTGAGAIEWRGRVHDLGNGETKYFREWEVLLAFLRTRLASSGDASPSTDSGDEMQKGAPQP
jgi:hypothetical protein